MVGYLKDMLDLETEDDTLTVKEGASVIDPYPEAISSNNVKKTSKKRPRDEDTGKHVKFSELVLLDAEQNEYVKPERNVCRACKLGYFCDKVNASPFAVRIAEFIKEFAFKIDIDELVSEIHDMAEKERESFNTTDDYMAEFTEAEIKNHLFNCMTDGSMFILDRVRKHKLYLRLLENMVISRDESGELDCNDNKLRTICVLENQVKNLLGQAPEKFMGYKPSIVKSSRELKLK